MPVTLTYFIDPPDNVLPPAPVGDLGFSAESSRLVCDVEAMDEQHFLDMFDRLFPEDYLAPMKNNPNAGYELFEAFAAVGARVSQALEENECNMVIVYSAGPKKATVIVEFSRPNANKGAVTIKAGTLLVTSKQGRQFATTEDCVFGALDVGPISVNAEAVAPGYDYNVRGLRIAANGDVYPGEIDTISINIQDPPFTDESIVVSQPVDATGGYDAWLDGHGDDRGIKRTEGESDDPYRLRIRTLPDTVSPGAVFRLAESQLGILGIEYEIVETWSTSYQTCWDCPSPNIDTPTYQATIPAGLDTDLFVYDDPRPVKPFRNRWLDGFEENGAFIVIIDRNFTIHTYAGAYDDPKVLASDFNNAGTGKVRGTPAYDATPSAVVQAFAYDGIDILKDSSIASFYQQLQKIKAMGVAALVDYYHTW